MPANNYLFGLLCNKGGGRLSQNPTSIDFDQKVYSVVSAAIFPHEPEKIKSGICLKSRRPLIVNHQPSSCSFGNVQSVHVVGMIQLMYTIYVNLFNYVTFIMAAH